MRVSDNISNKAPELDILNNWHDFAEQAVKKKHWEWFVVDQFLRGNHSIRGNPNDNTLVVGKSNETVNYPINKIFATFRAVRAFVTRHKPVIVVDPGKTTPASLDYARRANATLERDNQINNYRRISKEWAYFGVKYGIGYRQIGYDPSKKCCIRWTVDPFDLLIGQMHGEFEDAPYIIKTVVRTIGYWRNKYKETAKDIGADNELADSEYKDLSLQLLYQETGLAPSNRVDEQTKIGYECWYRVYQPNKLGGTINKVTFVREKVLDFEPTPFNEYPFVPYKSDITPNEATGEGHIKHIIPPQRMLNLLNTQMLEYNHIVNRGRFIKDKNAGFRVINTKEGQIIEKRPGALVQPLNPPSINPMLNQQLTMAVDFIEDLGGQHQASLGSTPARVSSGDAIEALQLGDSNNIVDLRDNFEDALSLEAAWILKMYSLYEKDGVVLDHTNTDGSPETFAMVGAEAYKRTKTPLPERYLNEDNGDYCDVCAILPDNNVKVSITSQLGETRSARLNILFKLMDYGLPLNVVLKLLEFPNTSDIMSRIAEEAVADLQMEAMKAQVAPQPGQVSGQSPPGGEELPPEGAEADNSAILAELEQLNQQAGGLANG